MLRRSASSSPVPVNNPPDGKDGRNNSYQDDDSCSCTHQDQHQPLSLEKHMQQLLDSKLNMISERCTLIRATHLLTGVSKCVIGNEDLAGGPGLGLTPQGLTTVCTAS